MRPLIELAQSISRQATMELNVLKHSQVAGFLFELRAFRSLPDKVKLSKEARLFQPGQDLLAKIRALGRLNSPHKDQLHRLA